MFVAESQTLPCAQAAFGEAAQGPLYPKPSGPSAPTCKASRSAWAAAIPEAAELSGSQIITTLQLKVKHLQRGLFLDILVFFT